jgi:hypothetical protein
MSETAEHVEKVMKAVVRHHTALRRIADQPLREEMHAARRRAAMINDQSGWLAYEALIHTAREALYDGDVEALDSVVRGPAA